MKRNKKLKQSPIVILIPLGIFSVKRMSPLLQQNGERGFALQINQRSIALVPYCCLFLAFSIGHSVYQSKSQTIQKISIQELLNLWKNN